MTTHDSAPPIGKLTPEDTTNVDFVQELIGNHKSSLKDVVARTGNQMSGPSFNDLTNEEKIEHNAQLVTTDSVLYRLEQYFANKGNTAAFDDIKKIRSLLNYGWEDQENQ